MSLPSGLVPVTFPDGRVVSEFPVEFGWEDSELEPVVIKRFVEYDDIPCVLAKGGSVFRMRPSNDPNFPYRLEEVTSTLSSDAAFKGSWISEEEAIELVR